LHKKKPCRKKQGSHLRGENLDKTRCLPRRKKILAGQTDVFLSGGFKS
jgi:hypothetical protein